MEKVKGILFNKNIITIYIFFAFSMTLTFFPGTLVKFLIWSSFTWALAYIIYIVISDISLIKTQYIKNIIFFMVIVLLSAVLTLVRERNAEGFIDSIQIMVSYIVYFFFLMVPNQKNTGMKNIKTLCFALIAIYLVPIVMAAVQAVFNISIEFVYTAHGYLWWRGRYYTLFASPNGHASICVILVCAVMYIKKNVSNKILKAFLTFYQICAIIAIGMCASRGVLVATVAGIGTYYLLPLIKNYDKRKASIVLSQCTKAISVSFVVTIYMYFSCNIIDNIVPMIKFSIDNRHQYVQEVSKSAPQETKPPVETVPAETTNAANISSEINTSTDIMTVEVTTPTETLTTETTTEYITSPSESKTVVQTVPQFTFDPGRDYQEQGVDPSNGRFEKWIYALKTVLQRPIFGHSLYGENSISCHNAFLTILLSYGILGFSVFMVLIIRLVKDLILKYKKCSNNEKEFRVILAIIAGILVKALTGDILIFTYENINIIFYCLLGIMCSAKSMEE